MKTQQSIRVVLTTIFSYCMLTVPSIGWTQDEVAEQLQERGRGALKSGRYEEAIELFSSGASRAADAGLKARLNFHQAVALQQMADQETNPQVRVSQLRSAARLYTVYMELNPDSAAAANNLAKIYTQMSITAQDSGHAERAPRYSRRSAELYQQAIAVADSRQGLYLKNYAQLLERTGDWEKAKSVYKQIIREQATSAELQQSIADRYTRHGLDQLTQYLWELLDAGYVQQTLDSALNTLRESAGESNDHRIELLTIVCAALAEETYDVNSFPDSSTGSRIAALAGDTYLGRGAAEITRLHKGLPLVPSDYGWWLALAHTDADPSQGLWPTRGFQTLIRSLGSRAKKSDSFDQADGYFRLSAKLQAREVDPAAIRALVQMYAESNRFDKIKTLLDEYQVGLFESKRKAISNDRDGEIFAYHQTLGELYALIGRWGDSHRPDSAIYQLEHARKKSIVLASRANVALAAKYQFTPQMVDMLAAGYDETGETKKIATLRIDQAEIYQKAGDTNATKRVLSPLRELEIPSSLKTRYESLKITPVNPSLSTPIESPRLQLGDEDSVLQRE